MQLHRLHSTDLHHIHTFKCVAPHLALLLPKAAMRQVSTAAGGTGSSTRQQQPREASLELKKHPADGIHLLATASAMLLPLACVADEAAAAMVCLDVPDWIVDWRGTLIHSPVVAVGAAGLALVLFPKLIRVRRCPHAPAGCAAVSVALRVAQHLTRPPSCSHLDPTTYKRPLCGADCHKLPRNPPDSGDAGVCSRVVPRDHSQHPVRCAGVHQGAPHCQQHRHHSRRWGTAGT